LYRELGAVYDQSAEFDKAVKMYEQVLVLEPGSSEIHSRLGKLHARQSRYQQAINHFQKALDSKPSYSEHHLNLADLYLNKLNDKQTALDHLKMWMRKAPGDKRADRVRKMIGQIEAEDNKRTSNIE
jgi:tetratricopeptide (TPR) repeat protein